MTKVDKQDKEIKKLYEKRFYAIFILIATIGGIAFYFGLSDPPLRASPDTAIQFTLNETNSWVDHKIITIKDTIPLKRIEEIKYNVVIALPDFLPDDRKAEAQKAVTPKIYRESNSIRLDISVDGTKLPARDKQTVYAGNVTLSDSNSILNVIDFTIRASPLSPGGISVEPQSVEIALNKTNNWSANKVILMKNPLHQQQLNATVMAISSSMTPALQNAVNVVFYPANDPQRIGIYVDGVALRPAVANGTATYYGYIEINLKDSKEPATVIDLVINAFGAP